MQVRFFGGVEFLKCAKVGRLQLSAHRINLSSMHLRGKLGVCALLRSQKTIPLSLHSPEFLSLPASEVYAAELQSAQCLLSLALPFTGGA